MYVLENYPLSKLTTFKVGGPAKFYIVAASLKELLQALDFAKKKKLPVLILGQGSNLVVSDKGLEGVVIKPDLRGLEVVGEDQEKILLKGQAGEAWDQVVKKAAESNWWGIENLSSIPGTLGAFPVQNVGAYGQEASQTVKNIEALDLTSGQIKRFTNPDCQFGYRVSVFNSVFKGKYVILSVTLSLSKIPKPNLSYLDVKKLFEQRGITSPNIGEIRQAIIEIRKNKFPDVAKVGNAGSFFKNLILTQEQFDSLKNKLSQNFGQEAVDKLEQFKSRFATNLGIKIPTAFLIDLCKLKGSMVGGAQVFEKPQVLTNANGQATALDVLKLAQKVKQAVYEKTGMKITNEPGLVGFSKQELDEYYSIKEKNHPALDAGSSDKALYLDPRFRGDGRTIL